MRKYKVLLICLIGLLCISCTNSRENTNDKTNENTIVVDKNSCTKDSDC